MTNIFDNLWVEKYRPCRLADMVLSAENRNAFENMINKKEIPHLLLCGAPGIGKTTLAKILVNELDAVHRYINASDERGIDAVREKIVPFAQTKSIDGCLKIVILDEVDGFTSDAQRALRNIMEEYSDNLRFILTANYRNRISDPIKSRTIKYELMPPLKEVITRAVYVLANENISVPDEQKPLLKELIEHNYPDIRLILGLLQKYTRSGVFNIVEDADISVFAREVIKRLGDEKNISSVREFIIQNEIDFSSDYLIFLKSLFEEVYALNMDENKKASALVLIGDAMYKHQFVMDPEINAYCCIIQLQKFIS
ncbi:MAG: AAA family ATPase [Clostridia bacterium]|nr:AAA family ATPase [Clostridia bacterium]